MKQTRDDVIREENGALLVDINGLPIPFEVANREYRDQLSLIIEQALSPRLLGLLERSSKLSQNFVQSRLLWMKLFRKHFPVEYNHVTDKDGNMHPLIKLKLDAISQNPEQIATYWKRYYEWLYKSRPAYDNYAKLLSKNPSGNVLHIKIPYWQYEAGGYWLERLDNDKDTEYIIRRHPDNPVEEVYIMYPNIQDYNGKMLYINTEDKENPVSVIDYNKCMTDGELITTLTPRSVNVMWKSPDGLRVYLYNDWFIYTLIPEQRDKQDEKILVSCVVCSEPSNMQCSHCNEIYCSVNCQATTH